MKIKSGEVAVSGRMAYVPQYPWIINTSVRENILVGSDFEEDRPVTNYTLGILLSPHADRHVGDISFTVFIYFFVFSVSAGFW